MTWWLIAVLVFDAIGMLIVGVFAFLIVRNADCRWRRGEPGWRSLFKRPGPSALDMKSGMSN